MIDQAAAGRSAPTIAKFFCAPMHDAPSPATAAATAIAKKICAPVHDAPSLAPARFPASTRPVCSRRASSASSHYRRISGFAGVNPGASDVKNDDLIEGRRFPAACCRELQYGEVLMIFGPAHHTGMRTSQDSALNA